MITDVIRLPTVYVVLASTWATHVHAADKVIVNTGHGSPRAVDLPAVPPYRNPQAPPPTGDAVAAPRPSIPAPGAMSAGGQAPSAVSRAFGSFGIPFSSTRVATGASNATSDDPNYLATSFPYRAVGKLTFSRAIARRA